MTELKFYRGLSKNYRYEDHSEGIYFSTDTRQIIHNGIAYGIVGEIDLTEYTTKNFIFDILCGYVKDLVYDPDTGDFSYIKKKEVYNDVGEKLYLDEVVSFSLRSNLVGTIKDINFLNDLSGKGYISYSRLIEVSKEHEETGEILTILEEKNELVEIPDASYSVIINEDEEEKYTYLSGLMSGQSVKLLDDHTELINLLQQSSVWNFIEESNNLNQESNVGD